MPEEHSFDRSKLLASLILLVVVVLGAIWFFNRDRSFGDEMFNVTIIEVNENRILTSGTLNLISGERIQKTIEFTITPETIITRRVVIADPSVPDMQPYTPEIREESGDVSYFKPKRTLHMVRSAENLANLDKAVAKEIIYNDFIDE